MNLNLGCGQQLLPDYVDVDVAPLAGIDVVADLNQGLTVRDATIDHVLMNSVLEHLDEVGAAPFNPLRAVRAFA